MVINISFVSGEWLFIFHMLLAYLLKAYVLFILHMSLLIRSVRSFVRSLVRALVRSFGRGRSFVLLSASARSFFWARASARAGGRAGVRSFVRSLVRALVRSFELYGNNQTLFCSRHQWNVFSVVLFSLSVKRFSLSFIVFKTLEHAEKQAPSKMVMDRQLQY